MVDHVLKGFGWMLLGIAMGSLLGGCLGYIISKVVLGDSPFWGEEISRMSAMSGAVGLGLVSGIVCGVVGGVASVVQSESAQG